MGKQEFTNLGAELDFRASVERFAVRVRALRWNGEGVELHEVFARLLISFFPSPTRIFSGIYYDDRRIAPDLTVTDLDGEICSTWIEVKELNTPLDRTAIRDQVRRYIEALPHVTFTNGWEWVVYESGQVSRKVSIPREWLTSSASLSDDDLFNLKSLLSHVGSLRSRLVVPVPCKMKKRVVSYMSAEQARQVKRLAFEHQMTISQVLEMALGRWLDKEEAEDEQRRAKK